MAQLGYNFDASRVPPAEPGAAVWEGVVPMQVERTEIVDTAAKQGDKMLVIHVKAVAGEYVGQSNVIRLNLFNKSPQAQEIAHRQLSSICHVSGRMQIQDSDQLIGAQFLGIWAKEERTVTDTQTGMPKTINGCQCKDYKFPDGRTIKEAVAGKPAAEPYNPNAPQPQTNSAPQSMPAPQGGGAPGFPQGGAPSPQGAPQTGMVGYAPAGGFVPGQAGGAPAPAAPGISTAASPSNGYGAPPAGPAGGGFVPGAAPGAPQGGYQPQPGPGAAPQGFPQPQGPGGFTPGAQPGPAAGYQPQPDPNAQYQPQPGGQPPFPGGAGGQPGPWGR